MNIDEAMIHLRDAHDVERIEISNTYNSMLKKFRFEAEESCGTSRTADTIEDAITFLTAAICHTHEDGCDQKRMESDTGFVYYTCGSECHEILDGIEQ